MKLINGREVKLEQDCILEDEDNVYILCKDNDSFRILDMYDGNLCDEKYSTIDELEKFLDYKFRRIVYDGVVKPDEGAFVDVKMN